MNKIRNIKSRYFWFNYRTGAVDYTSESRPSSNWRLIQASAYTFETQEEKDRLLSEADIVFRCYETQEDRFRNVYLTPDNKKNFLVGYVVKKNQETNNFDSLYF
jgi:hypothetical protein